MTVKSQQSLDSWLVANDENGTVDSLTSTPSVKPKHISSTVKQAEKRQRENQDVSSSSVELSPVPIGNIVDFKNLATSDQILELNRKLDLILTQQQSATHALNNLESSVVQLTIKVKNVEKQSNENQEDIDHLKLSVELAHANINSVKEETKQKTQVPNNDLTSEVLANQAKVLSSELSKLKQYGQRHNLLFCGLVEYKNEDCVQILDQLIKIKLGLPNAHTVIDKAHRLGRPNPKSNHPRPIIVRFTSHHAAEKTFMFRSKLHGTGIWMKRHLPENVERQVAVMEKIIPMARAQDPSASILPGNQLRFERKVYDIRNIYKSGLPVHTLHERENTMVVSFQGMLSPLSNFHACSLNIDGTKYSSIEQYYQAEKAKRHNDHEVLAKILLESDPVAIKRSSKRNKEKPEH